MKDFNLFSETQISEWLHELKTIHEKFLQGNFSFTRNDLISEHEVVELLEVTSRTLRTYRKKRYLHFIKLEGRVYYLRQLFYIDMVMLSQNSWRGGG